MILSLCLGGSSPTLTWGSALSAPPPGVCWSLVEAAGLLQTELLSAARICCLSILQERRQFKGIYKGRGSRITGNLQNQRQNGAGQRGGAVTGGDWEGGGWRMGGSTWGRTCRQARELEGQRGTSSETGGWEIGSPREKEVLTLQSAPQGQANPTALLCFFLTIHFKCSHL